MPSLAKDGENERKMAILPVKVGHGGLRGVGASCFSSLRRFGAGSSVLRWGVCDGMRDAQEPTGASSGNVASPLRRPSGGIVDYAFNIDRSNFPLVVPGPGLPGDTGEDEGESGNVAAGGGRVWMWRGDPGVEQLRMGALRVMPGLPELLVVFCNCAGDAGPLVAFLPLSLASISDSSSASGLTQTGRGEKRVAGHVSG